MTSLYYGFNALQFIDILTGWAVGGKSTQEPLILHTEDGGETWEEKMLPTLINFYGSPNEASVIHSIQFANDTLGWLTCEDEYHSGYILLTTNGGETWQQQYVNENIQKPIYDICMVDNNNGWAVGADYIYHTNNGDTIIIVGIEEKIRKKNVINIIPNPTNGIFTIKINYQLPITNYRYHRKRNYVKGTCPLAN